LSVNELTNQLDVPEIGVQAKAMSLDLTTLAPVQELTAQVNALGFNADQIVKTTTPTIWRRS
jgi:hypothetical protein